MERTWGPSSGHKKKANKKGKENHDDDGHNLLHSGKKAQKLLNATESPRILTTHRHGIIVASFETITLLSELQENRNDSCSLCYFDHGDLASAESTKRKVGNSGTIFGGKN